MFFKEVHKGIDSLYLSFRGDIKDEILEELIKKRELAKSDDEALQAQATMIWVIIVLRSKIKEKGSINLYWSMLGSIFRLQGAVKIRFPMSMFRYRVNF